MALKINYVVINNATQQQTTAYNNVTTSFRFRLPRILESPGMSRFSTPPPRTLFASKTNFDALAVDSGEDTEDDENVSDTPPEKFEFSPFASSSRMTSEKLS